MSTKEEKEKQQKTLEKEKYKRDKQIAIIKASNQMLEDAKENIRENWSDDPIKMEELLDEVNILQNDNLKAGQSYLHASEDEINHAEYGEASELYKRKYANHLEKVGLTDEQMRAKSTEEREKSSVKVTLSSDSKKEKEKKWFSFSKKKSETNEVGEEVISSISHKNRTVEGEGFVKRDKTNEQDPEKFMKEIAEKANVEELPEAKKPQEEYTQTDVNKNIESKLEISDRNKSYDYPEFDPANVSPLTRYDIIELPSKGECYASKKGRIPVRELTASDENLIASPNMYANGQLIETIVKRCVLDKSFNVDEMCNGDLDAVVMWLRATAYGPEYNVSITHPETGKAYKTTVNIANFKYKDFDLKGDENGYFDYTFENGDVAKFKILSFKESSKLQEDVALQYIDQKKYIVYKKINEIKYQVDDLFRSETKDETLGDAIDYIYEWANKDAVIKDENTLYSNFMTTAIIRRTMSVNGNDDREYVENYINGLRISEFKKYRDYIINNNPSIDFSISVEIPESDGGGSFESIFQYGPTVFIS